MREVLEIGRAALPENHWRIFQAQSALGASLVGQGHFEEAEPLVVDAYDHMKDDQRVPAEIVRMTLETVIRLYTAWEKPDEAARYRAMMEPGSAVAESNP